MTVTVSTTINKKGRFFCWNELKWVPELSL